jgi:hypothetical protein
MGLLVCQNCPVVRAVLSRYVIDKPETPAVSRPMILLGKLVPQQTTTSTLVDSSSGSLARQLVPWADQATVVRNQGTTT